MRRVGRGGGHVIGYAHAVLLCDGADVVGGSDGACDGSLLLVIGKAFAGEEGSAALGDLDDDGGLDVAGRGLAEGRAEIDGAGADRATSRTEFATEEEVQFWKRVREGGEGGNAREQRESKTHDGLGKGREGPNETE